ncbi:MAG TPA: hypothetical protein VLX68_00320 [Chitinivibrionales bacterium]|nr:hypothetical protein [Chitinivibrionales bacterium]
MRYIIRILLIAATWAWPLFGQAVDWPLLLAVPQPPAETDSNVTQYGSDQSLYIRTFKVRDSLSMLSNTANSMVNQNVDYELTNDSWFDTKDQAYDLSGEYARKLHWQRLTVGLEWTPVLILDKRTSSQGLLGSVDVGPVLSIAPFGVPVKIHGGATGRAWSDSLGALSVNQFGTLLRDKGYYAGGEFGNPGLPLPYLPLIVNAKSYGRVMGTSKLATGTGSALLYLGMPGGDSAFAYYADSLTDGRDAFLGQAQGKPHLINDPEKNERSYQVMAGIRGKTRFYFQPGVVYSYSEHTLSYAGEWGSRKNSDHAVNFLLATDSQFFVSYKGGFSIDWEREDKYSGQSPLASLTASLDDYRAYRFGLINSVSKYLKNGMGAEYTSDISRYSKDYPNFLVENGDTIRSDPPLDNDIIVNRQKFSLVPIPASWGKTVLFLEYSKNITSYIRKEMSANNTVDWFLRVGGTLDFTVCQRCTLSEAMSADVKRTDYTFPETKIGKPPPYSRQWTSLALFDVAVVPWLTLKTEWKETYWDFGTWNGRQYLDSTTFKTPEEAAAYKEYYAIMDKSWEHGVKLSAAVKLLDVWSGSAGCSYEYIDVREFNTLTREYALTFNAGSRVSPFLTLAYRLDRRLAFNAAFTRVFDIHDKFWDIHISLNGVF